MSQSHGHFPWITDQPDNASLARAHLMWRRTSFSAQPVMRLAHPPHACLSDRQFSVSLVSAHAHGNCHEHQVICDEEGGTFYMHTSPSRNGLQPQRDANRVTVWPHAAVSAILHPKLSLGCRINPLLAYLIHLPGDRFRSTIKAPTGRVSGLLWSPTPLHSPLRLFMRCYLSRPRQLATSALSPSSSRESLPPQSAPRVQ